MQLPELSIRRPVLAVVMSLLILLVGGVSYLQLTVREYPRIDEPVVTVSTRLAGASSEVIEGQVTKTLEDSIAGIEGVEVMTSISRSERSQISVRFKLDKDPDDAAADVRDRVARVRNRLPQATDEPQVSKVESDAQPMMRIAFPSDQLSPLEVTDYVSRVVRPRLQTAAGVADVEVNGDRRYAMRIWIEPQRLAAYKLTVQDVEDALRRQNLEVPAGRIESQQREFNVTAHTDLNTVAQFGAIVVAQRGGLSVRLSDVARVEEGAADERSRIRLNGRPSVGLGVIRQATANPRTSTAMSLAASARPASVMSPCCAAPISRAISPAQASIAALHALAALGTEANRRRLAAVTTAAAARVARWHRSARGVSWHRKPLAGRPDPRA